MDDYRLFVGILFFIFGLSIGSFLNVLIYRHGGGVITGRSKCFSCGRTLTPRMLVPLLSYIFQAGRCAHCRAKISPQYPLVELTTGLLFIFLAMKYHISIFSWDTHNTILLVLDGIIGCILILITVYDLRHKIIPDRWSLALGLISLLRLLVTLSWAGWTTHLYLPIFDAVPSWIDLAAGPFLALPFALLWYFSGGRSMGLGDAKLAWGIGWFLGFAGGITAVILGFWIAFFPSLLLLLSRAKHYTMKSELPFAPFLVMGATVTYIFGVDIISWTF